MKKLALNLLWSSLLLGGCTQSPTEPMPLKEDVSDVQSCQDVLLDMNVKLRPHAYQDAFEACDEAKSNEYLVEQYINALIRIGQFKQLQKQQESLTQ